MPIEVGIWRIGEKLERVAMTPFDAEKRLEDQIAKDLSILGPQLMLVGRQVTTAFGKYIDLLAIDPSGKIIVIELKRDRTPREVVAQILDYASWVQGLSYEDIAAIFAEHHTGRKFEEGFAETFNVSPPETINQAHELVVISSELDHSTERIINYLTENYGVPINAVFFRFFRDGEREYLARTWLIDPEEVEAKTAKKTARGSEPWNGQDFYVSLGEGEHRSWEDCVRYGFICGGGGRWYSQTLAMLFPGARVFVNIPKTGYVGIGIVKNTVVPVSEFLVSLDGVQRPILEMPLKAPGIGDRANDPEMCEYLVRVDWLKTFPRAEAYWEKGLFAIQHTACRMRNKFTIERLCRHFGIQE
jgi:hypothetical protein